jgi:hypothetical protein
VRRNHFPNHVQAKLDTFERQVVVLTQQVAKTQAAINNARTRLSGGFERQSEYDDMRASLVKLVKDLPAIENKLDATRYTLTDAKAWLANLPDDTELVPVATVKDGYDLATVHSRINDAEDEIKRLRAVPVPSADIAERVREHVSALSRPTVSGIGTGQPLRVTWPDDVIAVLALLLPEQMVAALLKEIERQSKAPMPLPQRKQRIAQLLAGIDILQSQALALGADTAGLPPAVVLGVRVTRREETKRVA